MYSICTVYVQYSMKDLDIFSHLLSRQWPRGSQTIHGTKMPFFCLYDSLFSNFFFAWKCYLDMLKYAQPMKSKTKRQPKQLYSIRLQMFMFKSKKNIVFERTVWSITSKKGSLIVKSASIYNLVYCYTETERKRQRKPHMKQWWNLQNFVRPRASTHTYLPRPQSDPRANT